MKVSIRMTNSGYKDTALDLMAKFGKALNVKVNGDMVTGYVHQNNLETLGGAVKLISAQIDDNFHNLELTY